MTKTITLSPNTPTRVFSTIKAGSIWSVDCRVKDSSTGKLLDLTMMQARLDLTTMQGKKLFRLSDDSGIRLLDGSGMYNVQVMLTSEQTMQLNNHVTVKGDFVLIIEVGDEVLGYPIYDFRNSIERNDTEWQTQL